MHYTRYEHAALRIDLDEQRLIIDPGSFTRPIAEFVNLTRLVAVIVTHEHPDHWTPEQLRAIADAAPQAVFYGPAGVVAAVGGIVPVTEVAPGDTVTVGNFTLEFFGGKHAVIHSSIPVIDNVGVLINDEFYYPGDSWAVPEGRNVKVLACPTGAPWLKIADAMGFVLAIAPRVCFGTHDKTLSDDIGLPMHRQRLAWATEQGGGEFVALEPGSPLAWSNTPLMKRHG